MSGKSTFSIKPLSMAVAKIDSLNYTQEANVGEYITIDIQVINKGNISGVLHIRLYSIAQDGITEIKPLSGDIWDSKAASPECSGHSISYTTFRYTFSLPIPDTIEQMWTLGIKVWSEYEIEPNFEV